MIGDKRPSALIDGWYRARAEDEAGVLHDILHMYIRTTPVEADMVKYITDRY